MKRGLLGLGLLSISTALLAEVAPAATTGTGADMQSSALSQGLMLAAFVAIFYFFILRPQSKRAKEQKDMITKLSVGDEVITVGGIVGKIQRMADDFFVITVGNQVEIVIQKQAVAGVLPKGSLSKI